MITVSAPKLPLTKRANLTVRDDIAAAFEEKTVVLSNNLTAEYSVLTKIRIAVVKLVHIAVLVSLPIAYVILFDYQFVCVTF